MSKKNFCALPFHHISIRSNGSYGVCCQHEMPADRKKNIRDTKAEDWLDGEYLREVRQYFIEDRRHPGCQRCWQDEDRGIKSMRIRTEQEYRILGVDTDNPKVKNIELQPSNLCNLSCLMCNESNSSVIQAENQRLGISKIDVAEFKWGQAHYDNLSRLFDQDFRVLNVLGGEPFYNKALLDVLEKLEPAKVSNSVLQIITNATFYNDRWQQVMAKFGLVRFMISLDGVGKVYEYLRYPAKWSQVENNVDLIRNLTKTKIMISCVVQNLNILYLDRLIEWCQDRDLFLELPLLNHPSYLRITNLPLPLREKCLENLCLWIEKYPTPNIRSALESFRNLLLNADAMQDQEWEKFKIMIEMRDRLRNNSWRHILPIAE